MTTLLSYWLLPLALFLGLWGCAWSITVEKRRRRERGDTTPIVTPSERIQQKAITTMSNTGKIGLGIVLGVALGIGIRDRELNNNTRLYFGVVVVSQHNDHRYTVAIPGFRRPYDWEFCHPLKMPGPLIDIMYEQRYGCKAVNGVGFVQIHEESDHGRTIQDGRNSAPTESTARLER